MPEEVLGAFTTSPGSRALPWSFSSARRYFLSATRATARQEAGNRLAQWSSTSVDEGKEHDGRLARRETVRCSRVHAEPKARSSVE